MASQRTTCEPSDAEERHGRKTQIPPSWPAGRTPAPPRRLGTEATLSHARPPALPYDTLRSHALKPEMDFVNSNLIQIPPFSFTLTTLINDLVYTIQPRTKCTAELLDSLLNHTNPVPLVLPEFKSLVDKGLRERSGTRARSVGS